MLSPNNFGLDRSERIESPNFVGIVAFRFQNIGQNFNASVHVGFHAVITKTPEILHFYNPLK